MIMVIFVAVETKVEQTANQKDCPNMNPLSTRCMTANIVTAATLMRPGWRYVSTYNIEGHEHED